MFEYAVNYFWLERKSDSLIGRISERLSEDAGSIAISSLVLFLDKSFVLIKTYSGGWIRSVIYGLSVDK